MLDIDSIRKGQIHAPDVKCKPSWSKELLHNDSRPWVSYHIMELENDKIKFQFSRDAQIRVPDVQRTTSWSTLLLYEDSKLWMPLHRIERYKFNLKFEFPDSSIVPAALLYWWYY